MRPQPLRTTRHTVTEDANRTKEPIVHTVKKVVGWLLAAFLVYAIFTSPGKAGDIVHTAWDIIGQGFTSLGSFFDAVLSRG